MKAEMTANGTLVLFPESGVEAYALMQWQESANGATLIDLSAFPEVLSKVAEHG